MHDRFERVVGYEFLEIAGGGFVGLGVLRGGSSGEFVS